MTSLPHNLEAERSVLGSVLIRPSLFAELDGVIATDDFFLPAHRETWEAMRACNPLDTMTLFEEMSRRGQLARWEKGAADLMALSNEVPTAENGPHYARIVREKAILRRLIALTLETASRAGGDCSLAELLTETRTALDRLEVPTDNGPVRVGDALDRATDVIEARAREPEKHAVMSGLAGLDSVTGGFRPGQVVVIAANPGAGKTALAFTSAIRASMAGVPALVFSMEMSRQELVERAITFAGNVPELARGRVDLGTWQKIRAGTARLRPLPLWVDDRKLSMGRIAAEARSWKGRHARDQRALLVVDYLGLVRSDSRSENRQLEVAAMSRAFKQLAGDLGMPLFLVSQLNRENTKGGERRRPVLSDLRDSGAIEQDADIVIFPWHDGALSELIVAKHRNGRTGTIPVKWRGDTMAFYDDTGDDSAPREEEGR
ncbi:MAG TPA: DnaB-like helicase C-terminal domain-containing protein [Polyangia bacterium]|jgi:replicative DNA helicase